jgi:hypothetical protein
MVLGERGLGDAAGAVALEGRLAGAAGGVTVDAV